MGAYRGWRIHCSLCMRSSKPHNVSVPASQPRPVPPFLRVADMKSDVGATRDEDVIRKVGLFSASEDCGHHAGVATSAHHGDNNKG
jgi:hypothetical protein